MALSRRLCNLNTLSIARVNFSTSCLISNKWRLEQGLEREPRKFGPLTNQSDYSFVDGRPTPLSYRKMQKVLYQQKICERIVELTNEIDTAKELYKEKKAQEEKQREFILRNKLKPKGPALLKKTKGTKKASDT